MQLGHVPSPEPIAVFRPGSRDSSGSARDWFQARETSRSGSCPQSVQRGFQEGKRCERELPGAEREPSWCTWDIGAALHLYLFQFLASVGVPQRSEVQGHPPLGLLRLSLSSGGRQEMSVRVRGQRSHCPSVAGGGQVLPAPGEIQNPRVLPARLAGTAYAGCHGDLCGHSVSRKVLEAPGVLDVWMPFQQRA